MAKTQKSLPFLIFKFNYFYETDCWLSLSLSFMPDIPNNGKHDAYCYHSKNYTWYPNIWNDSILNRGTDKLRIWVKLNLLEQKLNYFQKFGY